jgi:hypothetical protein
MLNARCVTKGMVKSRLTSCLLLIANNCWTRSFALGYWLFSFSSVLDSDEERTPLQKKDFSSEYVWPYLPLPLLGTVNFRQSVNILCWTICWIKNGRHMILVLAMSLPLRVYFLMRCTHNALGESLWTAMIVQYHILAVSCLWQDLQDLFYWVVCIPFSTSRIVLSLRDLSG